MQCSYCHLLQAFKNPGVPVNEQTGARVLGEIRAYEWMLQQRRLCLLMRPETMVALALLMAGHDARRSCLAGGQCSDLHDLCFAGPGTQFASGLMISHYSRARFRAS